MTRDKTRAKRGGEAGLSRDHRERALAEIYGQPMPVEIDRRHKTWRGAADAAATLTEVWK